MQPEIFTDMQTKILYITDDEDELNTTAELIKDKGIEMLKAQNVEQALKVLQNELNIALILVGLEKSNVANFMEETHIRHIPKVLLTVEMEEIEKPFPTVVASLSIQDSTRWDRLAKLVKDLPNYH